MKGYSPLDKYVEKNIGRMTEAEREGEYRRRREDCDRRDKIEKKMTAEELRQYALKILKEYKPKAMINKRLWAHIVREARESKNEKLSIFGAAYIEYSLLMVRAFNKDVWGFHRPDPKAYATYQKYVGKKITPKELKDFWQI